MYKKINKNNFIGSFLFFEYKQEVIEHIAKRYRERFYSTYNLLLDQKQNIHNYNKLTNVRYAFQYTICNLM